jgi:hypothetical protein
MTVVIPLYNFGIEKDNVGLWQAEIINIEIIETVEFTRDNRKYKIELSPYRLCFHETVKAKDNRLLLLKTLAILKLFKDGTPSSNIILKIDTDNPYSKIIIDYLPHFECWRDEQKYPFIKPLVIKEEDIESFVDFWEQYYDIDPSNFALERFILADHEYFNQDMLIKYVECLEYLFVPDSKDGNISYKLCSRASMMLAQPEKRKELFESIKESYNLRSRITHGPGAKSDEVKNKLGQLRELCRESIKLFFKYGILDNKYKRNRKEFLFSSLIYDVPIKLSD